MEVGKTLISGIPISLICYFSLPYFLNASAASLSSFFVLAIKIAIVGLLSMPSFFGFSKLLRLQSYEFFRSYILGISKKAKRNPQLHVSD